LINLVQHLIKPGPAVKLAAQIEGLVRDGRIAADALLPPVRELAHAIGVSPGTAAAAYKALRTQGLVATDGRRGTRVLPRPSAQEYMESPAPAGTVDLLVANPDPRLLPDLRSIFASIRTTSDSYGGAHVEPELVDRMSAAFRSDGIDASHLVVTSGAIATIYRALRACLAAGDKVAVEDPGFNEHHASVRAHAMVPVPVAIDDEGMLPDALSTALRGGAHGVILTPRLQSPTGAALSRGRAAALREVLADHPDVVVLLDDFSSLLAEVPYHDCLGKRGGRWLVVRSFNKAIAPDLRVGVAAADAETADRLAREQWLVDGWVSIYLQRIAGAALKNRSVTTLLHRARKAYALRRSALIEALARRGIRASGKTGLNVWVPVPEEGAAIRGLLERGWCVRAGARYRLRSAPAIRITTAQLLPDRAERLADDLAAVLSTGPVGRAP
jgi:DNA-binding transcriptional MocR family regulator